MDTPLVLMNHHTVAAMDPASGRVLWKFPCDFYDGKFMRLVLGGAHALVLTDRGVHCLDMKTGERLSFVETKMTPLTVLQQGDRVYCAGTDGVYCVTKAGKLLWEIAKDPDLKIGAPALGLGTTVVQADFD